MEAVEVFHALEKRGVDSILYTPQGIVFTYYGSRRGDTPDSGWHSAFRVSPPYTDIEMALATELGIPSSDDFSFERELRDGPPNPAEPATKEKLGHVSG